MFRRIARSFLWYENEKNCHGHGFILNSRSLDLNQFNLYKTLRCQSKNINTLVGTETSELLLNRNYDFGFCCECSNRLKLIAKKCHKSKSTNSAPNPRRHKTEKIVSKPRSSMTELSVDECDIERSNQGETQALDRVGWNDGWLSIGPYKIFAWSVSGLETCVIVKTNNANHNVQVAFDMGAAIKESIKVKEIFISHGHMDHIGAVSSHVSKRSLFGMGPARYFVPPHLVDNLLAVTKSHYLMAETVEALSNVNILPFAIDDVVRLNSNYFVKSFPTKHRVQSQGYIVYSEQKKLKQKYRGKKGFEIATLHREGTEIYDTVVTPEFAYTGDTTFEVFLDPPTPDLLKVKLLITEATYIDRNKESISIKKARERGHCHLVEFSENANLFQHVGHIILMHFSNKYSPMYVSECLTDTLPNSLKDKVTPAIVAKTTKYSLR